MGNVNVINVTESIASQALVMKLTFSSSAQTHNCYAIVLCLMIFYKLRSSASGILSLQMLLIFLSIIVIFVIGDKVLSGFLECTISWNGIIESILLAFSYAYIRKLIIR